MWTIADPQKGLLIAADDGHSGSGQNIHRRRAFHSGWQRLGAVTADSYKPTAGDLAKNHVGKSLGRLLKGSLSQLFPRKSENVPNGRGKQQLTHKGGKTSG